MMSLESNTRSRHQYWRNSGEDNLVFLNQSYKIDHDPGGSSVCNRIILEIRFVPSYAL